MLGMRYTLQAVGLFLAEVVYLVLIYEPHPAHTQASLMLIFAIEMGLFLPLSRSNIDEKKAFGAVSSVSRAFTSIFGIGVLGMIALAIEFVKFDHTQYAWGGCFVLTLVGKVGWERYRPALPV